MNQIITSFINRVFRRQIPLTVSFLCVIAVVHSQVTTISPWTNQYHGTSNLSGSFTVPAGTNSFRVLVVALASTQTTTGTARTLGVTYGGQALSLAASDMGTTTTRQHTAIYYLNEAGIDAATSTTLAVTFSGGTARVNDVWTSVYDYVDQSASITNSQNYNNGTTASSTFIFATRLSINENNQGNGSNKLN